jgi:nitroreductase
MAPLGCETPHWLETDDDETNMSAFNEGKLGLIFGRRSVRVYTPGEVSDAAVVSLLEAAMAAPSAMTKDPWRFVVVRQPETLSKLAGILPGGKMLPSAPLAIVVCGDQEVAFERHPGYLIQDCSAAIQNLLLAAHGLGLGACWVGVYPAESGLRQVRELLSLPGTIVPVAVIAVGAPGEHLEPRTRFNRDYVHHEKW